MHAYVIQKSRIQHGRHGQGVTCTEDQPGGGAQELRMQVAALEAEATAAAAAASVAKRAAAAFEERLGEASRERAAACRAQQVWLTS